MTRKEKKSQSTLGVKYRSVMSIKISVTKTKKGKVVQRLKELNQGNTKFDENTAP